MCVYLQVVPFKANISSTLQSTVNNCSIVHSCALLSISTRCIFRKYHQQQSSDVDTHSKVSFRYTCKLESRMYMLQSMVVERATVTFVSKRKRKTVVYYRSKSITVSTIVSRHIVDFVNRAHTLSTSILTIVNSIVHLSLM